MRDAAQFFKVLSDESRLKILWLLFNHRELCVCDVMEALEITQSKASRHLIALRHAGLVSDRKDGLWSNYALRPMEDELSKQHLDLLRKTLAKRQDAHALLAKLREWLEAKERRGACSGGAASTVERAPRRASAARGGRR